MRIGATGNARMVSDQAMRREFRLRTGANKSHNGDRMKANTLIFAMVLIIACAGKALAQDTGGEKMLLGPISIEQLTELPDWFGHDFLSFMPRESFLNEIPTGIPGVEILCVLGSWCSDSKREVPRLIRIMQLKSIDPGKLKMFGADRNKMTPGGESADYHIEKVPTFIFFRDDKEIGRIVEKPEYSFERDMLAIVKPDARILQALKQAAKTPPPPPPHEPPPPPPPPNPAGDAATSPDGAVK
jgi:hypothetical protein